MNIALPARHVRGRERKPFSGARVCDEHIHRAAPRHRGGHRLLHRDGVAEIRNQRDYA